MSGLFGNLLLVVAFILVGGFFAGAEIALVTLRESQVRALAHRDRRGARVAALRADPGRFLAAVQIGVTLAGFLSAAFGGATLADDLAPVLIGWGMPAAAAPTTALVFVTLVISYLSLVLGELAPKRLALQHAERVAVLVAGVLDRLALIFRPVIWLLERSTELVVRATGNDPHATREPMSQEELRDVVAASAALSGHERALIEEVLDAGQRTLAEVLVPRTAVTFLDETETVAAVRPRIEARWHTRFPVVAGSHDEVVGVAHVRDLYACADPGSVRIADVVRPVLRLPPTRRVLDALADMRHAGAHLALVVDEYGGTAGIVTLEELVEELVGDIRDEYEPSGAAVRTLPAGAIEVDGLLGVDEFTEQTGVRLPPGPYETVAGCVTAAMGRLPRPGDDVLLAGHRFTVLALDGRRVARLRVTPRVAPVPAAAQDRPVHPSRPGSPAPG